MYTARKIKAGDMIYDCYELRLPIIFIDNISIEFTAAIIDPSRKRMRMDPLRCGKMGNLS